MYPTCFPEPTVIAVRLTTAVHLIIPFWYAVVEDEESYVERNGSYLTKISMARPKKTCAGNYVDRSTPSNDKQREALPERCIIFRIQV